MEFTAQKRESCEMSMQEYQQWCQSRREVQKQNFFSNPPKTRTIASKPPVRASRDEPEEEEKTPCYDYQRWLKSLEGAILMDQESGQTDEKKEPVAQEPLGNRRMPSDGIPEQSNESDSWNQESVRGANSLSCESPREQKPQEKLNLNEHLRVGNMRLLRQKAASNQVMQQPRLSACRDALNQEYQRQSARVRPQEDSLLFLKPQIDESSSTKDQPEEDLKIQQQNQNQQIKLDKGLSENEVVSDFGDEYRWLDIEENPTLQISLAGSQCIDAEIPNKPVPSRPTKDSSKSLTAALYSADHRVYIFPC